MVESAYLKNQRIGDVFRSESAYGKEPIAFLDHVN